MNKSQRIYLNTNNIGSNKNIFVKLEQDIDTLEIMSLKIDTKEIYRDFNADFGVLIGRVNANEKVGIPNAKVSIFIPLDEEDENDGEIVSIYPYKAPTDENNNGKRYNLLPRVGVKDPFTGVISPKQPFGSFPTREEMVTNPTYREVYKKYYKYTTVTNNSGDYMIFGVPIGTQTVHMSVDITDIKEYSMTPATMVDNLGYSEQLFNETKTKIIPSNDLTDLVNIDTQEISVNIIPFWGDQENFQIGITRQDFRIKAKIVSNFTIFGSAFTDDPNEIWGSQFDPVFGIRNLYRTDGDEYGHITIRTKQTGIIDHKIYYYPADISDERIESGDVNPVNDMKVLNSGEYVSRKENGDFVFIINCNRKKVITNELGEKIEVPLDYNGGIFTEFRGFITLEIPTDNAPLDIGDEKIAGKDVSALRYKIKIPQQANRGKTFSKNEDYNTAEWRKQHKKFEYGKIYSIAKFNGLVFNNNIASSPLINREQEKTSDGAYLEPDVLNQLPLDPFWNTGIIYTQDDVNDVYEFPFNGYSKNGNKVFGANWLNFSIYLPQFGYFKTAYEEFRDVHSSTNFTINFQEGTNTPLPYGNNEQDIAAGEKNTRWFARSDLHYTDFITVPKEDLINIINTVNDMKGFRKSNLKITLKGDYRNGQSPCPENGGKRLGIPSNPVDTDIYFYRGFGDSDCFRLLLSLGLV